MIRIMAWNIERFGVNKLQANAWDTTGSRTAFITSTIAQANPDVLVIIEVQTNAVAGFGGLISDTSGAPAVQALLWWLRGWQPGAGWSVVPPLIISPGGGYSEGIAVFFKSTNLSFWGPWMWNGVTGAPLVLGMQQTYAGTTWDGYLPAAASTRPGPVNQDTLAGQYRFFDAMGNVINFPNATSRSVWMTQFQVLATGRGLSLFSVHFPPKVAQSRQAFGQLARVPEITSALVAEDRVVLGDFNINALNGWEAGVFQHLTGGPGVIGGVPVSPINYIQQFAAATSIKSVKQASTTGAAPYYSYAKLSSAGALMAIDNMFVARAGGAAGAAGNAQVANRVIGTAAAPVAYTMDMVSSIPAIIGGLPPGGARKRRLNTLVNYGHIGGGRGSSDHMPVVIDLP
ncbi:MAG TPA: hypothetical protein VFG99_01690 [Chloroflexia bacterium]|nr:hypothetical protein [Chloroflexia bacterium]